MHISKLDWPLLYSPGKFRVTLTLTFEWLPIVHEPQERVETSRSFPSNVKKQKENFSVFICKPITSQSMVFYRKPSKIAMPSQILCSENIKVNIGSEE